LAVLPAALVGWFLVAGTAFLIGKYVGTGTKTQLPQD